MSDLFQEEVPVAYILRVFEVCERPIGINFKSLRSAPKNFDSLIISSICQPTFGWASVWKNKAYTWRIDDLRHTRARTKFLSIEPLLGPIADLDLKGIDWVIVGGESGPKAWPIQRNWIVDTRRRCTQAGVAFFFKQWGGINKKKGWARADRRTYDEMPRTFK